MKKYLIASLLLGFGMTLSVNAADMEAAKANWDRNCKKCHGETGAADTTLGKKLEIVDYSNPETLKDISDEELFQATKEGVADTKMRGYSDKLSDEEIHALVEYIRSMAKS